MTARDADASAHKVHMVIAIDGPAASGKSSTSRWVAEELGFRHLDSGALYRAITAARLRDGAEDPESWTEESLLSAASRCSLAPAGASFLPMVDGQDAEAESRGALVTRWVSLVARFPAVREWVNGQLRSFAASSDVVVDGRDIGTAVFPAAAVKIFLVADPWERARRRLIQRLGRSPVDAEIATETERLVQRDALDANQSAAAKDAILIDTTYLTQTDQVQRIVALAKAASQHQRGTSAD